MVERNSRSVLLLPLPRAAAPTALATGDLVRAADHNLLTVVVLPWLGVTWLRWARRTVAGLPRPAPGRAAPVRLLACAIFAFWLLRNVPGVPFLGSGVG